MLLNIAALFGIYWYLQAVVYLALYEQLTNGNKWKISSYKCSSENIITNWNQMGA